MSADAHAADDERRREPPAPAEAGKPAGPAETAERPARPEPGEATPEPGEATPAPGEATRRLPQSAAVRSESAPDAAAEAREVPASLESVKRGDDAAPVSSGESARVPRNGVEVSATKVRRLSSAGALIWVLLALFGFTLVVQLRSNNTDEGLASARQEDLVRILSDLEARDTRLQAEIAALETSQRQLTSGVAGRQAALAEADKRATELGLLAGTVKGRGQGLVISIGGVKASAILNAVQELRGAGGEVMQIAGTDGGAVRIVASTYFVDAAGGGILVDGTRLTGPYTLTVIGQPQTMETALRIPGGVVASVGNDGGSVTMEQRASVDVTAVRQASSLQYARPVS
ncbi:MAG TPA: DUF881 domain-containing protein [Actinoplanes sp.]|nr:DUF881 domain-containing protein [Actinoplanes sp.]